MRIRLLWRVIFSGLFLVWAGLFVTQGVWGPRYRLQSERNRTRLVHFPAARGSILDRRGMPLAEDRMSFELRALPQELSDPDPTWKRLQGLLGIPPEELARRYRKGFLARFSPVTLVRDLPPQKAFLLEEERADLPGILVQPVPQRHYPSGPAAGPVCGYLGLIAPEELTRLKPYGYTFRDRVGKDGLEQQYDSLLRGKDGGVYLEVNAQGRFVQQMGFRAPQRGRQVTVSIDGRLQELGYRLLDGGEGAVIVMDSRTGEVLTLVSSPSFDPNAFVDVSRAEEVHRFLRDSDQPMFNRAIRSKVPPGSTFKAAIAYEGMKEGKISSGTAFECTGQFQLGRSVFRCWQEQGHAAQTVAEALEHSCNVFFYNTGRRLGVQGIAQAARLFHLDQPTGIDLPRESKGLVPDAEWMSRVHQKPWQEGDTLSYAIGQSALQVTPMQMLLLFSAIAMKGEMASPHLLLAVEGEGPPAAERKPKRILLDDRWTSVVRRGLERVVSTETGTGRLARVPGVSVAGKTGTAQVPQGASHAWFCGYAPAQSPRYAFVVFLEHGGKGGVRAAQVAGRMVEYLKEMEYL